MKRRHLVLAATLATFLVLVASAAAVSQPTITSGPSNLTNSTSASFAFTGVDTNVPETAQCSLDGAGFADCDSATNQSYSGLSAGSHTFQVRATDGVNTSTADSYTWTIDTTDPNTTITSNPPASTASTTADFNYTSTEGGSTFECQLDGGGFSGCPASGKTYNGLSVGGHSFQVRATDPAGNIDPTPDSYSWTVTDSTPPDTTITSGPAAKTKSTSATFHYTSTESGSTFRCRRDALAFSSCAASGNSYSGLPDGPHTFQVEATDSAGNPDPTPASYLWTVDTVEPNSTITQAPATPTNLTSATFQFQSNEGGTFKCRVDGGNFSTCTSPVTYTGLGEAVHTFEVQATDDVLNVESTPARFTWTIDLTPGSAMRNVVARPGDAVVLLTYRFPPGINSVRITRTPTGARFPVKRLRVWRWRFADRTVRNGRLYTYTLESLDPAGNPNPVTVSARPRDPLIAPRDGALVRASRPPLFRWTGVAGATQYDLIIVVCVVPGQTAHFCARRARILSVFPTRPQYQLPRRWRCCPMGRGRRRHLSPGAIHDWYAYPWFASVRRYGKVIGANWMRVRR